MKTTTHTDSTRATSPAAPATRFARSRAILFLAAACALAPAANAASISWVGSTAPAITADTTVTFSGGTVTYATPLTGSGALTVSGATASDVLELSKTLNGYSGNINITSGTLKLSADNSSHAGNLTVSTGATLSIGAVNNLNNSSSYTYTLDGGTLELTTDSRYLRNWILIGDTTIRTVGAGGHIGDPNSHVTGGHLSGSGSLTITKLNPLDAGSLVFDDAQTYTGSTTVEAGTLWIRATDAIKTSNGLIVKTGALVKLDQIITGNEIKDLGGETGGTIDFVTKSGGSYVTLTLNKSGDSTFPGSFVSTGAATVKSNLIKTGGGTLTLSGDNQGFKGHFDIRDSTLSISSSNNLPDNAAAGRDANQLRSSKLQFTASGNYIGDWNLSGDNEFLNGTDIDVVYKSNLSGSGNLLKDGGGKLTLSGAASYSGTTTIKDATLAMTASNTVGTGTNTLQNATLEFAGATDTTYSRLWTLVGAVALHEEVLSHVSTQSGVLSGEGRLTKTGAGTIVLSGTNLYSGGTTISAGLLAISKDDNLGSDKTAALNKLNGGTLQLSATATFARNWELTADSTIRAAEGVTATQSGVLSGTGRHLSKIGSGTLVLSGANEYTGGTTISAGILAIAEDDNLGSDKTAALNILNGGALSLTTASGNYTRSWTLGANGGTITTAVATTQSGDLIGGAFTKDGIGVLTLSGANTYTGPTTIKGGNGSVLALSGASTLTASSGVTLDGNGKLDISGIGTDGTTIKSLASIATTATTNVGVILGEKTLTVFSPAETTSTFAGVISGAGHTTGGALVKTGPGILVLAGANAYTGSTTIAEGVLSISNDGNLGSTMSAAANKILNGGILELTSNTDFLRDWTIYGTVTLRTVGAGSHIGDEHNMNTGKGIFSGEGNLILAKAYPLDSSQSGAIVFDAPQAYTGSTTLSSGYLHLRHPSAITASSGLTVAEGTTVYVSFGYIGADGTTIQGIDGGTGTININTNSAPPTPTQLILAGDRDSNFPGKITGGGTLVKKGTGTLTLSGNNKATTPTVAFTGAIQVLGGTLSISSDNNLPSGNANTLNNATLQLTGEGTYNGSWALTNANKIEAKDVDVTLTSALSGAGGFEKTGSGQLILTNNNTYSGATTVSTGTLTLKGTLANSSVLDVKSGATAEIDAAVTLKSLTGAVGAAVTLDTSRTLTVSGTESGAFAGVISGAGNLTKSGTSVLTLSGANLYTGATTVNGSGSTGTLALSGSGSIASSSGVTLSGSSGNRAIFSIAGLTADSTTIKQLTSSNIYGDIVLGSKTLEINGGLTDSFSGVISDGTDGGTIGGITKSTAGTLTLSGVNTYKGATTVNGTATIALSVAGSIADSSGVTLADTATFTIASVTSTAAIKNLDGTADTSVVLGTGKTLTVNGAGSFAGIISSGNATGGFIKSGSGTLTLSGANTYTNATTVSGNGILALSGAGTLATSSGLTLASNGKFSIAAITDGTGATLQNLNGTDTTTEVILGAQTLTVSGTVNGSYAGAITGTGALVKSGSSTLTLSGTGSDYSGGTTISAGVVSISADVNLGAVADVSKNILSDATLTLTGATTYTRSWTLDGTGTITTGVAATQSGILSGVGSNFTKDGTGTLTLSGLNDYTGLTTIKGGSGSVLALSGVGTLAISSGVTLEGSSKLDISAITPATGTTVNNLASAVTTTGVVLGSNTLTVNSTSDTKFSGLISGTGALVKTGSKTLEFLSTSAKSTYSGGTTISAGTVIVGKDDNLGSYLGADKNFLTDGATLAFNTDFTSARNWTLSGNVYLGTGGHYSADLVGASTGSITVIGGTSLVFDGVAKSYAGSIIVDNGYLWIRTVDSIKASNGLIIKKDGTVQIDRITDGNEIQDLAGDDGAKLNLVTVGGGAFVTLTLNKNGDSTFAGTLSSSGDAQVKSIFAKIGGGTLTLSGNNQGFKGFFDIKNSTLSISNSNNLPDNAAVGRNANMLTNAKLQFTATGAYVGDWRLSGANEFINGTDVDVSYTGAISNLNNDTAVGSLTKNGGGKLTFLTETSTYTGGTTIKNATVSIVGDGSLGSNNAAAKNTLENATLELRGINGEIYSRGWTLIGTNTINRDGATVFGAVLSGVFQDSADTANGAGNLVITGNGNVVLSGSNNTYTGSTTVSGGALFVRNSGALSSSGVHVAAGATLALDTTATEIKKLTGAVGSHLELRTQILTINGTVDGEFSGDISSTSTAGALVKSGSSTLTLSGANTYTGATTVNGTGTLALSGAGTIATSASVTLNDTATLSIAGITAESSPATATVKDLASSVGTTFVALGANILTINSASSTAFGGKINGTGALIKTGAGTLTLSGSSGYSGGTTISAGTVSIGAVDNLGTNIAAEDNTINGGSLIFNTAGTYTRGWTLGNGTTGTAILSNDGAVTQSGALIGTGTLTKNGSGVLTLTAANTYRGLTTVNSSGQLHLSGDGSIAQSAGVTLADTAKFNISAIGAVDSTATIKGLNGVAANEVVLGDKILNVAGGGTYKGLISGDGRLVKSGSDTLTLSRVSTTVNTYTGGTTISGGILGISKDEELGTNLLAKDNFITNGGTLQLNFDTAYYREWTLSGNVGITTGGHQWGDLFGTGNLTITAATANGSIVFDAAKSYEGTVTVTSGNLWFRVKDAIKASAGLIIDATGAVDVNGYDNQIKQLTGASGGKLILDHEVTLFGTNTNDNFAGTLSGAGNLSKTGGGTLTLGSTTNATAYTGNLLITNSTLSIGNNNSTGTGTGNALTNATLELTGETTYTRAWKLTGANTINAKGVDVTQSGVLAQVNAQTPSSLTKTGSGTLTLSGANTYNAGTTIAAGTLSISSDGNLGSDKTAGNNQILNGGTLLLTVNTSFYRDWTLVGDATISTGPGAHIGDSTRVNLEAGGILSGEGNLIVTRTGSTGGALVLNNINTYTGSTTVNSGTLYLRHLNAMATSSGITVKEGAGLRIDYVQDSNVKRLDGGTGTINISGVGGKANLTLTGDSRGPEDEGGSFDGIIEGIGSITKTGTDKLTLTGTNTYTGGTILNGGTISIGADANLGGDLTAAKNKLGGGTLELTDGTDAFDREWELTASSTISVTKGVVATQHGALSGTAGTALTKSGAGTLVLDVANSYDGGTTISGGVLSIGADNFLGSNTIVGANVLNGGTLELTGTASARNWTLGTSGGTISTEVEVTQSGLLVGSGDFTKDGSGKLTLNSPTGYYGVTTVAAGILALADYAALPNSSGLKLLEGATLDVSELAGAGLTVATLHGEDGSAIVLGEKNLTVSSIIDFTGTLTSTGGLLSGAEGSKIKLTGASTLSAIDVTATSTLIVNDTLAGVTGENFGRITINVLNEGLLGGDGLITGNITVYDGGTLSPGNSPGALVVDGRVELQSGATLFVEITSGNGSDSVTVADTESVFLFNDASIVSVDLSGMFEPSFDWTIVTGAVAFGSGGLDAVRLSEVPGWVLTLEAGEGSKNLTLHGTQVPEPGTYGLLVGIGAVALALIRRRKKVRAKN